MVSSVVLPPTEAIVFAEIKFVGGTKTPSGDPVSQRLWWKLGYWYQQFHRIFGLWQNWWKPDFSREIKPLVFGKPKEEIRLVYIHTHTHAITCMHAHTMREQIRKLDFVGACPSIYTHSN